jgi:hypothetical protein
MTMTWAWLTPTRRRKLGVLAIIAGVTLAALFGYRAVRMVDYHRRVARGEIQVESLRAWMTLPYISKHYGVPESALREALGLPETGHDERNLSAWFRAAGVEPAAGRKIIESLIVSRQTPPGTTPP